MTFRRISVALALTLAMVAAAWRIFRDRPGAAHSPAQRRAVAFIGAETCRPCHAVEDSAWRQSQHARAMQEADERTVLGDFNDATFTYAGVTTAFMRRGDAFMVRTDGPDGALADFPVRFTFGVYPLQQLLLELPRGRLQALSIAWDARPAAAGGQRWMHLYPDDAIDHDDPLHWTGRQQNWNFMCADCHSTGVARNYDADSDSFHTTWSDIDVSCEACHGPGSAHARWAERPAILRRLVWKDDGLPIRLNERRGIAWTNDPASGRPVRSAPRETSREIQQCARCHSRRAQIAEDATAASLHDAYIPSLITPGLYHADGQQRDEVYTYGSFLQSRMYHAGVTCSDCHEPHGQKLRVEGDGVCLQCHRPSRATPDHHGHDVESAGARCVSCHMPASTYMRIDPRRDHSIRIPRPELSAALGTPDACTGCHADRTAAWAVANVHRSTPRDTVGFQRFAQAFHADETDGPGAAEALAAVAGDSTEPAIARASALERLAARTGDAASAAARSAIEDPDPMVRHAALSVLEALPPGTRLQWAVRLLGDSTRAVRIRAAWVLAGVASSLPTDARASFARAADEYIASRHLDADRPESRILLGDFLARLGRAAEAVEEYRSALRIDARFPSAWINLADALRALNHEDDAERALRDGLAVAPDDSRLHHALGLSLARSGRRNEATNALAHAAALAPDDATFTYAYAVALHSSGRADEAIALLERSLAKHPDDAETLFALASFHRDAGRIDDALRYARRLATAHPNDPRGPALAATLGG